MLDDLKNIHDKDAVDALGIAAKEGDQLRAWLKLPEGVKFGNVYNIVFAGMGGSRDSVMKTQQANTAAPSNS